MAAEKFCVINAGFAVPVYKPLRLTPGKWYGVFFRLIAFGVGNISRLGHNIRLRSLSNLFYLPSVMPSPGDILPQIVFGDKRTGSTV